MFNKYWLWILLLLVTNTWAGSECLIPAYYAELAIQAHQQNQNFEDWQSKSLPNYADSPQLSTYLHQIAIKAFQQPKVAKNKQQQQLESFVTIIYQQCENDFNHRTTIKNQ